MKLILLNGHQTEFQKQCPQLSTKNMQCLSSSFTKQLAIADINLTSAFLEKIKHHWGSFSVSAMLQEKLHHIVVSNMDAEVKVGWLKLWNGNRFDKDALHFPKSPLSAYWAQLERNAIEEFQSIFSSPLQLPADVPTLFEYIQTWKFAAFNSIFYREFQSGKVKKHNGWDEQPNIDLVMKRVLYMYNLILLFFDFFDSICQIFMEYLTYNILCVGIFDMC
jgi:hypothetical protein